MKQFGNPPLSKMTPPPHPPIFEQLFHDSSLSKFQKQDPPPPLILGGGRKLCPIGPKISDFYQITVKYQPLLKNF